MKSHRLSTEAEVDRLLAEIEEALKQATWTFGPQARERDAIPFEGDGDGWHFVVLNYEDPSGTRTYDGAARKGGTIVRFPRPLAERAFRLAAAALTETPKRDTNVPGGNK